MSDIFLQNEGENSLASVISNILPAKAKSMDFLVGYFYFSGIKEIYNAIDDKPMRILVGMDMDHDLIARTAKFDFYVQNRDLSRDGLRNNYFDSLVALFNQSDYFENPDTLNAFRIYYEKIKNGTLEIRKTTEPCHAKMYIFSYRDELTEQGADPGTVITGSSNLTYNGLRSNNEINVRFRSKPEYDDAEAIFNRMWDNAIVIADQEHIANFEERVKKKVWFEQNPTPYLLYLRVLYEYFHIDSKRTIKTAKVITNGFYNDLLYQVDAVRMGVDIIERHNGVIVADVVGLGKSIIGSCIAHNLHLRTIVIAPPHLVPQWESYCSEFKVSASVFSRGNMQTVLDFYTQVKHSDEPWLIVVDEAHAYRNEFIRDYAILHEICKGNKVMLLSATPFNNRPADIYAMIKLFQNPTRSTLQTVKNLGHAFATLIADYKTLSKDQREGKISDAELNQRVEQIASDIRRIINPLVIRRSRLDLEKIPQYRKDMQDLHMEFPKVVPPQILDYDLGTLEELYLYTLQRIAPKKNDKKNIESDAAEVDAEKVIADEQKQQSESETFHAARYQPVIYCKEEKKEQLKKLIEDAGIDYNLFIGSQRNLASFMRTLLVHRFESSQAAFRKSLEGMLANCKNIKKWMDKREKVPVYKKGNLPDIEAMLDSSNDTQIDPDIELEKQIATLQSRGMFEIPKDILKEEFFNDLDADIELLSDLKERWDKVPLENDPKVSEFVKILQQQLLADPERKIVVFSQYADTVDYLGKRLEKEGLRVFFYTSAKASKGNKEIIRNNFDAGLSTEQQQNDHRILIATDAISEGYNLHRAGTIFNFDIPYNPTRIIQRVGRINRINKKVFDQLFIYNYFPTVIGENETRTRQISTLKMAMIHAIMGEDTRYLTNEEQLKSFFVEQYKEMIARQEVESWDAKYRTELNQLENSDEMQKARNLPLRCKTHRLTTTHRSGIVAFARKGSDYVFKCAMPDDTTIDLAPEAGMEIFKATPNEPGYDLSAQFYSHYQRIKDSLTKPDDKDNTEKTRRDALDKANLIMQSGICDDVYMADLITCIEKDCLAGYALRQINRLKPAEYKDLPSIISPSYINNALRAFNSVTYGNDTLIVAEEIQNTITDPQMNISL